MPESSLADVLRKRGLRLTPQRQLVLEAVYELGHATPDQVHAKVAATAAGVNITTVYRTLELLEELGLVTHAHLSHGATTYHGVAGEQHVHLVCRSCHAIDEVPAAMLNPLATKIGEARNFQVDVGHVALFGLCAHCSGQEIESVGGQEIQAGHDIGAGHEIQAGVQAGHEGGCA